MSEQYPYPPAEHYVFPRTRAQVITDELRHYSDPEELREFNIYLTGLYVNTPIMATLRKFALIASAARIKSGNGDERPRIDHDFLAGSVFALHSTVRSASEMMGMNVLAFNGLKFITGDGEDDGMMVNAMVEGMQVWNDEELQNAFNNAPNDLQEAVYELADHMYCGIYKPQEAERTFISGYMYTTSLIDRNVTTIPPV